MLLTQDTDWTIIVFLAVVLKDKIIVYLATVGSQTVGAHLGDWQHRAAASILN